MASIVKLVPKVKGQSDYEWDNTFKPMLRNPGNYSLENIISKLKSNITSWDDEKRDRQRRQCIWILCVLLFHEGWDNPGNRERVLDLVNEWDIDEAVFYEMKDTAETYKVLRQAHVDDWDVKRSEEFKRNKKDLDTSIKNLIELG